MRLSKALIKTTKSRSQFNVLDKYDCAEVELPILQPCKILEESGRLQKYLNKNEIFCFQRPDNPNVDFCFAPTAEEAAVKVFQRFAKSYKDLPVFIHQISTKARNEILLHCEKGNCFIELGHIFQLGQSISSPIKATFRNSCGYDIPYYMGCYGIGTSRTLMAILETTCDDEGLCWPESIAPYKVMIIYKRDKEELASKLYHELLNADIEVVLDDREGLSIGSKIKDWKLFGFPYLIMIGDKTSADGEVFEVEIRKDGSKTFLKKSELLNFIK